MSALTEKVAQEHAVAWIGGSGAHERIGCECGVRTEQTAAAPMLASHVQHVAEVTEAATRAAMAAEIREQRFIDADPDWNRSSDEAAFDDALAFASRIAEGKQP